MSRAPPLAVVADRDERAAWTDPEQMQRVFSLLYNPNEFGASPFLPVLMEERLWRAVYGPGVRRRNQCWPNAPASAFEYRSVRVANGRGGTDDDSDDTASARKRPIAARPRRQIRAAMAQQFTPPVRNRDSQTGRSFEVQHDDGFLCPMHSLNNIANAVVLSPPDILHAIELVRTLEPNTASLEELVLAALREGIVLQQIKLTDASDLNPLDAQHAYPSSKNFLAMLEEARGMIVYTPPVRYGGIGHFVSLVYAEPPEGGLDPSKRWLVYSTSQVITRGATAAEALDKYILKKLGSGVSGAEKTREERRRRLEERNIDPQYFIGLLPLPAHVLWSDAAAGRDRDARAESSSRNDYLRLIMMRSLLRRMLSEARLQPNELGFQDIYLAKPVSPPALDELYLVLSRNTREVNVDGVTQWHGIFDGVDPTNVASLILLRHDVDEQMNNFADAVARLWLMEHDLGWPGLVLPVGLSDEEAYQVDLDNEALKERYQRYGEVLGQLRRLMREPTGGLGLMFADLPLENAQLAFQKFQRLITNRRWLRYLVIDLVSAALDTHLRRIATIHQYPLGVTDRRVMALLVICAFTSLRVTGVNPNSTPHISRLLNIVRADRATTLPLDSLPPMLVAAVRDGPTDLKSPFVNLTLNGGYEWYLWLLQSAVDAGLPGVASMSLAPFWALAPFELDDRPEYDDTSVQYDRMASFVTLLRVTLFMMPAAQEDSSILREHFYAQDSRVTTRAPIAQHFRDMAVQFVERAVTNDIVLDLDTALAWLDWLGYDPRYGIPDDVQWREAVVDLQSHLLNDNLKPRFVERAAQAGFDDMRRRAFGEFNIQPDTRTPITTNIDRVPLPSVPGNWRTTRPTLQPYARLCVAPMSVVPWWGNGRARQAASTVESSARMAVDDDTSTTSKSRGSHERFQY